MPNKSKILENIDREFYFWLWKVPTVLGQCKSGVSHIRSMGSIPNSIGSNIMPSLSLLRDPELVVQVPDLIKGSSGQKKGSETQIPLTAVITRQIRTHDPLDPNIAHFSQETFLNRKSIFD